MELTFDCYGDARPLMRLNVIFLRFACTCVSGEAYVMDADGAKEQASSSAARFAANCFLALIADNGACWQFLMVLFKFKKSCDQKHLNGILNAMTRRYMCNKRSICNKRDATFDRDRDVRSSR